MLKNSQEILSDVKLTAFLFLRYFAGPMGLYRSVISREIIKASQCVYSASVRQFFTMTQGGPFSKRRIKLQIR